MIRKDSIMNNERTLYDWRWQTVAFAIGTAIACAFVYQIDQTHQNTVKELTLGQLGAHSDQWDNSVLCVDLQQQQSRECIRRAEEAKERKVLWLGNSQLPTINQFQPGDRTMVSLLNESLLPKNDYVMGCAPPNANLQEHLLISHYLFPRLKPEVLLLPVFYDDFRETGVRDQLKEAFDDERTIASLANFELGKTLIAEHSEASRATTPTPTASESTLDWSEAKLNRFLESRSHYWSERGTYRSVLFVKLFLLRNTVFGIKADSIRRMIPERFERNMAALREILQLAERDKMKVLVYVPPIRGDVPIPYDMAAYNQFKVDLEKLVTSKGCVFANLENEIPGEFWGRKESTGIGGGQELDFMHFSARGHELLAKKIEDLLSESKWIGGRAE